LATGFILFSAKRKRLRCRPGGKQSEKAHCHGSLLILLVASLFTPFFTVYPHMACPAECRRGFPRDVTGLALILKGNGLLPVDLMPSLAWIPFRQGLLTAGMC
jgi:hypothetical protein